MPSKIQAVEMKAENLFCAGKEHETRIISSAVQPKEFVREESREEKTFLQTDTRLGVHSILQLLTITLRSVHVRTTFIHTEKNLPIKNK